MSSIIKWILGILGFIVVVVVILLVVFLVILKKKSSSNSLAINTTSAPIISRDNITTSAPIISRNNITTSAPIISGNNITTSAPIGFSRNTITSSPITFSNNTFVFITDNDYYQLNNIPQNLTNIKTVSIGGYHTLALKYDGTLIAWGLNNEGQATIPESVKNKTILNIETGNVSSFAILSDNTVVSWGGYLATSMPTNLTNVSKLAIGYSIGLALVNNSIIGWGYYYLNLPIELNSNIIDIATPKGGSGKHSLALTSTGGIIAWGSENNYDQLTIPGGTLYTSASDGIIIYTIPSGFKKVLCGEFFSIAIKNDNTAIIWGLTTYNSGLFSLNSSPNNNNIKNIVVGFEFIIIQNTSNNIYIYSNFERSINSMATITNAKNIYAGGDNAGYII